MHSPLSLQSFWLPQAFPMMHLRAVAEVAAFAVGEDFMAAACAPLSSGAALFTPDVQGDTGLLVARLPEEYRVALTLRDVQGFEYHEIAEVLNTPIGTIEARVFRARRRLRPLLQQWLQRPSSSPGVEAAAPAGRAWPGRMIR